MILSITVHPHVMLWTDNGGDDENNTEAEEVEGMHAFTTVKVHVPCITLGFVKKL